MSTKNLLLTIIGVIVAIVIAWFLVDVVFHLVWFLAKLIVVGLVALLVFFALRSALARGSD